MSFSNPDEQLVLDIVTHARYAREFAGGLSRDELDANPMRRAAVIRMIEIIGEAAGRLTDGFREAHPELPWAQMVGMRNILIHTYRDVDIDEVWRVVTHDLVDVIEMLAPLVDGQ